MLKTASLHPPGPRRAKMRPFPSFVLDSSKLLNTPQRVGLRFWLICGLAG